MSGFFIISFIAGMLTVLAPCILPLLPVIVGGSMAGTGTSVRRAGVIVISLGASVLLFTLALKATTAFINIPAIFWQIVSGCLIVFFGVATLWPSFWDRIPGMQSLYRGSNKVLGAGYAKKSVWGEVIMGASLGPVFSSCSPTYFVILAAVLPASFLKGFLYLLTYVIGMCLFLFVIALLGQKAVERLGTATDPNGWLKKVIGVVFIILGIAIIFGWDKQLEAALPAGTFAEVGIEQHLLSGGSAASSAATSTPAGGSLLTPAEKAALYPQAPELVSPDGYINTDGQPISLAQYRGKDVVLVDFWDYSCINCQRTIPYLEAWYQKYKDQGLVVIGVHTPEFAFEQLQSNVAAAAARFGITYPVVLDNKYQTWIAFQNQYWPREYLIDIDGYIVHDHAGEGDYDVTEQAIQAALKERAARLGTGAVSTTTVSVPEADLSGIQSPETYFGSNRNEYLENGIRDISGVQKFTLPTGEPALNMLYLGGSWDVRPEFAEATAGDRILYEYDSSDVYMVATNPSGPVRIKVLMDGQPVGTKAGADVDPKTSEATIDGDRLYTLIHDTSPGIHTIEIQIEQGTLDAYTFTFG